MKAAVLKIKNMQFEIRDVETPKNTQGESLIRVESCGICGTDLKEYKKKFETWKSWKRFALAVARRAGRRMHGKTELRLGHEVYGTIEETTNPELENKKVVVFPDIHCGTCEACRNGFITVCNRFSNIGFERDGGFAEYVTVPDTNIMTVPETVDPKVANLTEPLACALHAIEVAGLKKGDNVLVVGVGPIGLLITHICNKEFESETVACDVSPFRLKMAGEMGASATIKPSELQSRERFADVVFDCTGGLAQLMNQLVSTLRPHGTICVEGFYEGNQQIWLRRMQMKEGRLVTSQGDNLKNRQDAISKIELYGDELKPLITHTYPLENISQAFDTAVKHYETNAVKVLVKP